MNKEVTIEEPSLLIRISKIYNDRMSAQELYEATRGVWKIGIRRENAEFAFSVYQGEIKEVYKILAWHPAGTLRYETRPKSDVDVPGRWEFEGEIAGKDIRNKYIGRSLKEYFPQGASNPIIYALC